MFLSTEAQNNIYNFAGTKKQFVAEDIDITFNSTDIEFPEKPKKSPIQEESGAAILAALPTFVDIGFNLITSWLENNLKKFSGEYSKSKS